MVPLQSREYPCTTSRYLQDRLHRYQMVNIIAGPEGLHLMAHIRGTDKQLSSDCSLLHAYSMSVQGSPSVSSSRSFIFPRSSTLLPSSPISVPMRCSCSL